MKRFAQFFSIFLALAALYALPAFATWQSSGVTAEALGQANLRALPGVDAALVGEISTGTRYPVLGRAELYPWYLLGDPVGGQPIGWVYRDLVAVHGDINLVPFSSLEVSASPALPAATVPPTPDTDAAPAGATVTPPPPPPTPTLAAAVTGTVLGEINVRYGPGVQYPRVGIANAGDQFEILAYHTQLPWYEVSYPAAPGGRAWIASDLLQVQGDVLSLPSITQTNFNLPTLTPTPSMVQPAAVLGLTPVPLSPQFRALGDRLWQMMLDAGFETGTSRLGALFLMDLQTGEAITFGEDIAFSGMSLNKIGILATLYSRLNRPLDSAEANTVAEAMICSENISTNEMLSEIGSGDPFQGAKDVTSFLQSLGLKDTFITAPYGNDPFITPQYAPVPRTEADQVSAEPDPYNQMTVDDMGSLLANMYQCAYGDSGVLLQDFPESFEARECRQMLHVMSNNRIDALFESGVPPDTRIAHKHGWIDDTHGDAAIIFTPGGDYALVAVVHNPGWMDYSESFPLIAEISRTVYNYFNPDAPVTEIGEQIGAERCELLGNPLVEDLQSSVFDE